MNPARKTQRLPAIVGMVLATLAAALLTLALFLILPLMQTISRPATHDLMARDVDVANLPPPPPPPPPEQEEEEPEPDEPPPQLAEESPPLDLSQLELALNSGFTGDWLAGDFAIKLNTAPADGSDADALFSISDLDQPPRAIYQPSPALNAAVRKKAPGTVHLIFIVNERGAVESLSVQSSSDLVFEAPALNAVKQWKFEPGKRNGQPVRFRMRVPITFPKGT